MTEPKWDKKDLQSLMWNIGYCRLRCNTEIATDLTIYLNHRFYTKSPPNTDRLVKDWVMDYMCWNMNYFDLDRFDDRVLIDFFLPRLQWTTKVYLCQTDNEVINNVQWITNILWEDHKFKIVQFWKHKLHDKQFCDYLVQQKQIESVPEYYHNYVLFESVAIYDPKHMELFDSSLATGDIMKKFERSHKLACE